jgi:hypothetical protein
VASKRRLRRKACGDKQRHADQAAAVKHIIQLKNSVRWNGNPIRSYRCTFCGGWHVGHY